MLNFDKFVSVITLWKLVFYLNEMFISKSQNSIVQAAHVIVVARRRGQLVHLNLFYLGLF